jgi:hypothetical protein
MKGDYFVHTLEKTDYGVRLTWTGFSTLEELQRFYTTSKQLLPSLKRPWGNLINMVDAKPFPPESADLLREAQAYYRTMGMERSVVIVNSPTVAMQLRRVAKESGIFDFERYVDISKHPNDWETRAVEWLRSGVDRTE